jgi:hypothetical protein
LAVAAAGVVFCCSPTASDSGESSPGVADWQPFGAPFETAEPVVEIADLLSQPANHDGKELVIQGTVEDVCPKKG